MHHNIASYCRTPSSNPLWFSCCRELTASWLSVAQRDMLRLDALIMTVQLNIRRLLEASPPVGHLLRFAMLGHTVTSAALFGMLWDSGACQTAAMFARLAVCSPGCSLCKLHTSSASFANASLQCAPVIFH